MEMLKNFLVIAVYAVLTLDIPLHGFKLKKISPKETKEEIKRDEIPDPQWTREANGKLYSVTAGKNGFYENNDICENAGGYLATVANVLDQESLNNFIKKSKPNDEQFLWIGLNVEGSKTWIWANNKLMVMNFMNWSPGQPANNNALQDCGAAGEDGTWYSVSCDEKHHGICEKIDPTNGVNTVVPATKPPNIATTATTSTASVSTTASPSSVEQGSTSKEGKPNNSMKGGNFEKHPNLEEAAKPKFNNGERCNLIKFINNHGHPVVISRSVNGNEKKEFVIQGKTYKLNTVFKKVENIIRMDPVVYSARDEKRDKKLALDGKESFTLMPGDCDGEFVDVAITSSPKVKGIILNEEPKAKDEEKKEEDQNEIHEIKEAKEVPSKKSSCSVETFGGNSGNSCCHFPFKYQERMYHDCTTVEKRHLWCGTTRDFDKDAMWGFCCLEGECTS